MSRPGFRRIGREFAGRRHATLLAQHLEQSPSWRVPQKPKFQCEQRSAEHVNDYEWNRYDDLSVNHGRFVLGCSPFAQS
jgi:hypothetical protein